MSLYCILRSLRAVIILLLDSDVIRLDSFEGKTIFRRWSPEEGRRRRRCQVSASTSRWRTTICSPSSKIARCEKAEH